MHARLRRAARRHGVDLEIRSVVGERIDLPDASADAVISSLVLCTRPRPGRRPRRDPPRSCDREGGSASPSTSPRNRGTPTRWSQRILRRPWAWVFEGCSCERDLASVIAVRRLHQRRPQPLPDPLAVPARSTPTSPARPSLDCPGGQCACPPGQPSSAYRPWPAMLRRWTNTSWSLAGAPLNPGPVHVRGGLPGVPVPGQRNSSGVRVSDQSG